MAMVMAAGVRKPFGILPPFLPIHRSHFAALNPKQQIESQYYQKEERSSNVFQAYHHRRKHASRVYTRAATQGNGGKENCKKEGKVEDANAHASCEEIPETKGLASPVQPKPVKGGEEQQQQQQSCPEKEKAGPIRRALQCLVNKTGFHGKTKTSRDEDRECQQQQELGKQQKNSKQEVRSRLRSWWQVVSQPQNLLAAFLSGLFLYAFALFGWQVMVVAMDVTLLVLKCSFVAVILLLMYIFLI